MTEFVWLCTCICTILGCHCHTTAFDCRCISGWDEALSSKGPNGHLLLQPDWVWLVHNPRSLVWCWHTAKSLPSASLSEHRRTGEPRKQ